MGRAWQPRIAALARRWACVWRARLVLVSWISSGQTSRWALRARGRARERRCELVELCAHKANLLEAIIHRSDSISLARRTVWMLRRARGHQLACSPPGLRLSKPGWPARPHTRSHCTCVLHSPFSQIRRWRR